MNDPERRVVLIVEDEPLILLHSQFALEDAGYTVLHAGSAADALALLDANPHVTSLFTDIAMPGPMNGIALAHAVHARRPDISILIASGIAAIDETLLPENSRFLPKPYTAAQVSALIARQPA